MFDIYDSEAIIKSYRYLQKRCEIIDKFINNHAYYFGPCSAEYGALDVCDNIIELITRKNQLINYKLIVDDAIKSLDENDKKILFIKMNYSISMAELCGVLEVKERTAFRRLEKALNDLTMALNKSKYKDKLYKIMLNEDWLCSVRQDVKVHKSNLKPMTISV